MKPTEAPSPFSQAPEPFLRTLRALFETTHSVAAQSSRHIESLGLTPAQFDIVATLGDTEGMTCKQLGEGTLITKGTLTGVLDRLEARGLILRERSTLDSRQIRVTLTEAGEQLFRETFQPHVDFLATKFAGMPAERQAQLVELLRELEGSFGRVEGAGRCPGSVSPCGEIA